MVTRLPESLLSDAMTRLPQWSGDPDGISAHFVLDAPHREQLVVDIGQLAALTGHPIEIDQHGDGVDVTLVTDEVEGVSEVDIALATRITDLASGAAAHVIPQQRQAEPDVVAASDVTGVDDERAWWVDRDLAEPVIGVPATEAGLMPVPLPDTAPREPEPGIEVEQEPRGGEPLGFQLRGAGDPDPE